MSTQAPPITIDGGTLAVTFNRYDLPSYHLFLRVKALPEYSVRVDPDTLDYTVSAPARFAPMLGLPLPEPARDELPLSDYLFDDQRAIVRMALAAKRFAPWCDTGLGKTPILLEFARQVAHRTGGRVLIVTLANLVSQTMEMCEQFYGATLPLLRIKSRKEMERWCATGRTEGDDDDSGQMAGRQGVVVERLRHAGAGSGEGEPTADDRLLDEKQGGGGDQLPIAPHQQDRPPTPQVAIVNYEKFNPKGLGKEATVINEIRHLAGIILDESSRLAMGGGKQKWAIIHSSKGVPYKLSCTATPAPNAVMEFASQASFLERMRDEGEIIWTYFTRDSKTHRWGVKKHARAAFFEFMSSWSIYVRDPRRYGWRKGMKDLPPPKVIHHMIKATPAQLAIAASMTAAPSGQAELFVNRDTNTVERGKLSQVAKGFRYRHDGNVRHIDLIPSAKPQFVADLIRAEVAAGHQVLVWTVFDAESDLIARALHDPTVPAVAYSLLTGSVAKPKRGPMLERFRKGETRVLISRASMLGFGMNFQLCSSMVFSGWSDSYVAWYQAIRRAYRYGQTKTVRVHVPVIHELEGDMLDNIAGKESRHEQEIVEMEANYLRAMPGILNADLGIGRSECVA